MRRDCAIGSTDGEMEMVWMGLGEVPVRYEAEIKAQMVGLKGGRASFDVVR